jgi:hypothetical protein
MAIYHDTYRNWGDLKKGAITYVKVGGGLAPREIPTHVCQSGGLLPSQLARS